MEQRLSLVTLGVRDLDRARRFYEALGWKRAMTRAEGVAFFQLNGIGLSLYPRADFARDAGVDPAAFGNAAISLAYNTRSRDEVDQVLARAAAAGGTILKPGHDAFWGGYFGHFADPDGFLWEVAWNPAFAIAPDGAVTLPD